MQPPVALIVGLGNPGPRYEGTRHNAGFWFVDALARHAGASFKRETKFHGWVCRARLPSPAGHECWLLKPDTFMNHSGRAARSLAGFYKIPTDAILVAHDEIDLPPGAARLKRGGGHAGHNGLRDIIAQLGGNGFLRLRIGVGHPGSREEVTDYVLGKPPEAEREAILDAVTEAEAALALVLDGKLEHAMTRLHSAE